jgi:flagellar hook assembly protein FlgD
VNPGDATAAIDGNSTTLVGAFDNKQLIRDLTVVPRAFSPNGDGINDEVRFEFSVLLVDGESPVAVQVFDLSGRLVRRLVDRHAVSSGDYSVPWDGRDAKGNLASIGLYVAQIEVAADTDGADIDQGSLLTTVAVAY